jgi:hypothetical protein
LPWAKGLCLNAGRTQKASASREERAPRRGVCPCYSKRGAIHSGRWQCSQEGAKCRRKAARCSPPRARGVSLSRNRWNASATGCNSPVTVWPRAWPVMQVKRRDSARRARRADSPHASSRLTCRGQSAHPRGPVGSPPRTSRLTPEDQSAHPPGPVDSPPEVSQLTSGPPLPIPLRQPVLLHLQHEGPERHARPDHPPSRPPAKAALVSASDASIPSRRWRRMSRLGPARDIDPHQTFLQVDDVHSAVGADAAESRVSRRLPAVRSIWRRQRIKLDPDADSRISARFGDYRVVPCPPSPRRRTEHLSVGRAAHEGSRGQKCGTDREPKSRCDLAMLRHIWILTILFLLGARCVSTALTRPSRSLDPLVVRDT